MPTRKYSKEKENQIANYIHKHRISFGEASRRFKVSREIARYYYRKNYKQEPHKRYSHLDPLKEKKVMWGVRLPHDVVVIMRKEASKNKQTIERWLTEKMRRLV